MNRGSCAHCSYYIFWRTRSWRVDRGIARLIRNLGTRWICVVRFTSRPLYPKRKNLSYPLNIWQGDQKSAFGHFGEETNLESNTGYTSAYSQNSEWSIPASSRFVPTTFQSGGGRPNNLLLPADTCHVWKHVVESKLKVQVVMKFSKFQSGASPVEP